MAGGRQFRSPFDMLRTGKRMANAKRTLLAQTSRTFRSPQFIVVVQRSGIIEENMPP